MNTGTITMNEQSNYSGTEQALRWIGDLDHPFYDDERQRYVWYEAATIGFQLLIISQYLVVALALLIGGSSAMPWVMAPLAPILIVAAAVQWYSHKHHAPYLVTSNDFRRPRGLMVIALFGLLIAGIIRVGLDINGSPIEGGEGFAGGFGDGVIFGLGTVVAGLIGGALWENFRSNDTDSD